MGFTIDIDTGGTFTDGVVVRGSDARTVKVSTTPHDLTLCFAECIRACAEVFGMQVPAMLAQTELIRFCNTIGTNTIIQRDGSKIGLLVSAGADVAPLTLADGAPAPLVFADMIATIEEQMDEKGESVRAPDIATFVEAAQGLIDRGARALVVALRNSERNPAHENAVRLAIKERYPRDFLGSVPVFLSCDISTRSGYEQRINTAVINAYIHAKLARLLYKAGEGLRSQSFPRVLFIGHNNGAAARVAKTRPINTYNSGPTAGLLGARAVGALYGFQDVISTDMGGTSFDIGLVRDGRAEWSLQPDVEGFSSNLPMQSIRALGAGGGSIATVVDGQLSVGPRSAGAYPGPACFDRGGVEATVTDANLVLGLIDPDFFLGGRQKLNLTRAREVIDVAVARSLGSGIEEAALRIRAQIDRIMGDGVVDAARATGSKDLAIVAYGGAGPLHSCAIAERCGVSTTIVTPFSAVFSAFSSSLMDVGHVYYRRLDLLVDEQTDAAPLRAAVDSMHSEAERDMRGEGFSMEAARLEVHVFFTAGAGGAEQVARVPLAGRDDTLTPGRLMQAMRVSGRAGEALHLTSLALMVSAPTPHIDLRSLQMSQAQSQRTAGRRQVYTSRGWIEVPVLDMHAVDTAPMRGPVLLESVQTTLLVAEGFHVLRDEHANLLVRRIPDESRQNH